jgi:stearoyl-CoA desaturase (delta-9 desaturase)
MPPNLRGRLAISITNVPADPRSLVSPSSLVANFIAVVTPFAGLIVVLYGLWGWGVSATDLMLFVSMGTFTGLGITIGYHRLFTHRAFVASFPVKLLLGILGSMAVEGPLFRWVATHRRHHQHSDDAEDPHSPHACRGAYYGLIRGWWFAHIGWIFSPDDVDLGLYVNDLQKDAVLRVVNRYFMVWVVLGLVIPAAIGGLVGGLWPGAVTGLLWGGLVRTFTVHHLTWSVNSVCHLWGTRPFQSRDESRNNFLFALFAMGEGWHNNHHAFPTSARMGLRWWQIDFGYLVIRALAIIGLVRGIRAPDRNRMAAKLRTRQQRLITVEQARGAMRVGLAQEGSR